MSTPQLPFELSRERAVAVGAGALVFVLLVVVVARSCSSPDEAAPPGTTAPPATEVPTTAAPATTVPAPAVPIWPLTGNLADPVQRDRPALAVKVDNTPEARPQAGINQPDLVYELQVEGITRFMEVFHSSIPERVGPVRSARGSDADLLCQLGNPLFLWSGGNGGVVGLVNLLQNDAHCLTDTGAGSGAQGHYYRDRGRQIPHNLFANARAIHDQFGGAPGGFPGPILPHAPAGTVPPGAAPSGGVVINFGLGVTVEYRWDGHGWARFQSGQPFLEEGGGQVAPENVVVLFLEYPPDTIDARSPRAQSVGAGDGLVFEAGAVVPVRWKRDTNRDGWNLTQRDTGQPVLLGAGRAWVALPAVGQARADILPPPA
jgi:hypothetical protein